jgi:hypothetical protein
MYDEDQWDENSTLYPDEEDEGAAVAPFDPLSGDPELIVGGVLSLDTDVLEDIVDTSTAFPFEKEETKDTE